MFSVNLSKSAGLSHVNRSYKTLNQCAPIGLYCRGLPQSLRGVPRSTQGIGLTITFAKRHSQHVRNLTELRLQCSTPPAEKVIDMATDSGLKTTLRPL